MSQGVDMGGVRGQGGRGAVRGVNSDCNSITHARAAYLEEEGQVIPETTS